MLSFLFVEKGKLFIKKSSFEEFNLVFFTAEPLVCFEMQPRQRSFCWIFRYILHSMGGKSIISCQEPDPAHYFGKIPGFNLWKLSRLLGVFPPFVGHFFQAGAGTWSKTTSHCLRSLIGQLSLLLVPNMVLSRMNNHKHRTKQTYESYTFQPLMSFWLYTGVGLLLAQKSRENHLMTHLETSVGWVPVIWDC